MAKRKKPNDRQIAAAQRKARVLREKAETAQKDFEASLHHCNEILAARGETPLGLDDFIGDDEDRPVQRKRGPK